MKLTHYKWITGGLELMFSIPVLSMLLVSDTFYFPVIVMFAAHAFTFFTSIGEKKYSYGSVVGMFVVIIGIFYTHGWLLHLITAGLLLMNATLEQKRNDEEWEEELQQDLLKKQIFNKVSPIMIYDEAQYEVCLDTNVLLNNYEELSYLLHSNGVKINISRAVYDEIDRLRRSKKKRRREKAQRAFALLETYQKHHLLEIMNIPTEEEMLKLEMSENDIDLIIGTYQLEMLKGRSIAFLSNDKGARILARQVGIETIDYDEEEEEETKINLETIEERIKEMKKKNILFSILLTVLGGPFGIFYTYPIYAIIMLVITFFLLQMSIYGAMLGWMVNIVVGILLTIHYNEKLKEGVLITNKKNTRRAA